MTMKLEIRHGVDVGYFNSSRTVQNNMTHPDYPESKKGYPKDKTLEEMLVLAKDIKANIIIKAGKNAKWYLKHCPRHELDAEIENRPRWKNSKNATMYIVEFEAESHPSFDVELIESDGYSTPDEFETDDKSLDASDESRKILHHIPEDDKCHSAVWRKGQGGRCNCRAKHRVGVDCGRFVCGTHLNAIKYLTERLGTPEEDGHMIGWYDTFTPERHDALKPRLKRRAS